MKFVCNGPNHVENTSIINKLFNLNDNPVSSFSTCVDRSFDIMQKYVEKEIPPRSCEAASGENSSNSHADVPPTRIMDEVAVSASSSNDDLLTGSCIGVPDSPKAIGVESNAVLDDVTSGEPVFQNYDAAFLSNDVSLADEDFNLDDIMAHPLQVSTKVTDFSCGMSVPNLCISLYKLSSGNWICVSER